MFIVHIKCSINFAFRMHKAPTRSLWLFLLNKVLVCLVETIWVCRQFYIKFMLKIQSHYHFSAQPVLLGLNVKRGTCCLWLGSMTADHRDGFEGQMFHRSKSTMEMMRDVNPRNTGRDVRIHCRWDTRPSPSAHTDSHTFSHLGIIYYTIPSTISLFVFRWSGVMMV